MHLEQNNMEQNKPRYQIEFFGWCREQADDGEIIHDKVWGWVSIGEDSKLYNFWGARGGKYTFKRYDKPDRWSRDSLTALSRIKMAPSRKSGTYRRIPADEVMQIVPNFSEEFEKQLALAKLFDNFHGERLIVEA